MEQAQLLLHLLVGWVGSSTRATAALPPWVASALTLPCLQQLVRLLLLLQAMMMSSQSRTAAAAEAALKGSLQPIPLAL
jgi:hypothetical protein